MASSATFEGEVFRPGEMCGPYEIEHLLGAGGFAEVYAARSPEGGRRAIKVLRLGVRANEEQSERFRREIQLLSCIDHAHIVRFFDAGMLETQAATTVLWLAMEYLDGRTLRDVIESRPHGDPVPVDDVLRWGRQIAEGLSAAHQVRATHRDLKPENIAITRGDIAKVFDFGIAKFHAWGVQSTALGRRLGTALYMAPEQIRDPKSVDARTDVYALGLVLFELAAGRHPLLVGDETTSAVTTVPPMKELCRRQLEMAVPALDSVRRVGAGPQGDAVRGLSQLIHRATAKDPAHRFADMAELADALGELIRRRRSARKTLPSLGLGVDRSPTPPAVRTTDPEATTMDQPIDAPTASGPILETTSKGPSSARWRERLVLMALGIAVGAAVGIGGYVLLTDEPAPPKGADQR